MFYETAHTVGPGWHHRSYKPPQYEDMSWSLSSRHFGSPASSPETYRRISRTESGDNFPKDDDFFSRDGRRSPTFPRRIFKEVWNDTRDDDSHRFSDRPRIFKRVFRPNRWEDEEDLMDRDIPHLRRMEREFDENRPSARKFDDDIPRRMFKDMDEDFGKNEGKVHHIPIMVEKRMKEMKSRFEKQPPESFKDEECAEEWTGPQVQRLRKNFEQDDGFLPRRHRFARGSDRPRAFGNTIITETWDPHTVHTLPSRKSHKTSQSFDDARHATPSPKHVFRSYSETHDETQKPHQSHSAAFRSHSDGHCPNQTYITKVEVQSPDVTGGTDLQNQSEPMDNHKQEGNTGNQADQMEENLFRSKSKGKLDSPSLQQILVVLQNVQDLVHRVNSYNGTGRDKQYRFLDEMLTRCMLRLDDVDTEGREDVRTARKAALKEVQNCIDLLEAKANESERRLHNANKKNQDPKDSILHSKDDAIPLDDEPVVDQAIPLPDAERPSQAIPLADRTTTETVPLRNETKTTQAIPLGDGSTSNECQNHRDGPATNMAIPLADVPMSTMPIPLGYVTKNTEQNNQEDGIEHTKL